MRFDAGGAPLVPGYNVDKVDVAAGLAAARRFGYDSWQHLMVIEYALMRHARAEEDGAERTFLSYFPRDMTSWRVILATAVVAGSMSQPTQAGRLNS